MIKGSPWTGYRPVLKEGAAQVAITLVIACFPDDERPVLIGRLCSRVATIDGTAIVRLIAGSEAVQDRRKGGATAWNTHRFGEDAASRIEVRATRKPWTTGRQWKIRRWETFRRVDQLGKESILLSDGRHVIFWNLEIDHGPRLRRRLEKWSDTRVVSTRKKSGQMNLNPNTKGMRLVDRTARRLLWMPSAPKMNVILASRGVAEKSLRQRSR